MKNILFTLLEKVPTNINLHELIYYFGNSGDSDEMRVSIRWYCDTRENPFKLEEPERAPHDFNPYTTNGKVLNYCITINNHLYDVPLTPIEKDKVNLKVSEIFTQYQENLIFKLKEKLGIEQPTTC